MFVRMLPEGSTFFIRARRRAAAAGEEGRVDVEHRLVRNAVAVVAVDHAAPLPALLVVLEGAAAAGVAEVGTVVLTLRQRVELRAVVGAAAEVGVVPRRLVVGVLAGAVAAAGAERHAAQGATAS